MTSLLNDINSLSSSNEKLREEIVQQVTNLIKNYEELKQEIEILRKNESEYKKLNMLQERTIQKLLQQNRGYYSSCISIIL